MSEQSEESLPEITLQSLLEVIQKAPDISNIKKILSKHILDVFHVEMASIFLVDLEKQELTSWLLLPGNTLEKIVVPLGTNSIVGYVATKRQQIRLRDPYDFRELVRVGPELSFFATYDESANVRSKQILAIPLIHNNTLIGVVELINKKDDTDFTNEDQSIVSEFAVVLAAAFFKHISPGQETPPQYEPLLAHKLLSREDLEKGLTQAAEQGEDPETLLLKNFQIPRLKMGKLLAEFYSTRFADLEKLDNNPAKLFEGINIDYFEREELVPLSLNADKLIVAAKNIEDKALATAIQAQVPRVNQVELVLAFQEDIRSFWKRTRAKYLSSSKRERKEPPTEVDTSLFDLLVEDQPRRRPQRPAERPVERPIERKQVTVIERRVSPETPEENNDDINEPPVVQLVNKIIEGGYSSHASDIHIEPCGVENNGKVRYRIDGVCNNATQIPHQYVAQVIGRIKFLAALKRAERTRPQDGKIKFTTSEGKDIELRVATIPTVNNNEDIVIHISPAPLPLPALDDLIPARLLAPFQEIIEQTQGIILVVGPNASGKTTTLHAALRHINTIEKKIWTAEYPVEIQQEGIRQVQVDPLSNYTFATALRAILKADPDVIMIGEMLDSQTAAMAVDAARNGHLLFSSLPANSAAEAIGHCLNLGLEPQQFASSLHGVLAQRMVRTLCDQCKEPYHPERAEYDRLLESYGVFFFDHINVMYSDDLVFYRAKGCPNCNGSGYSGKTGLYELLVVDQNIRNLIMKRAPLGKIIEEAMMNDMTLLSQEGIRLFFAGIIDHKELLCACALAEH